MLPLFLGLFLFWTEGMAQEKSQKNIQAFEQAKKLHQEQKYEESLGVLDQNFNLQKAPLKAPKSVLSLAALNFEYMRSYKAAITHVYLLIQGQYRDSHAVLEHLYQSKKIEELEIERKKIKEEQLALYDQMGRLYSLILNDQTYHLSPKELPEVREKALFYWELCSLQQKEEAQKSKEEIEKIKKFEELRKYKTRWYMPTSLLYWRDLVKVSNSEVTEKVQGKLGAMSLGVGFRTENTVQGFQADLQVFIGPGQVTENNSLSHYQSKNNTVWGVLFSPGVIGHPLLPNIAFGIETPLLYRQGNYDQAPQGYKIENKNMLTPGILGLCYFNRKKIDLVFKAGKFLQLEGPFLLFGINWAL